MTQDFDDFYQGSLDNYIIDDSAPRREVVLEELEELMRRYLSK